MNLPRETVAGTIGLTMENSGLPQEGTGRPVEDSLKYYPHEGNLGVNLRWQPQWRARHSLSQPAGRLGFFRMISRRW